ncbi:hypothetical protein HPP92_028364 [Vanilla planifolia]|uniref:Uncharacterized protein n=1 Tax=Vanilla planifolia TaxID=51239 RepID=A0A835P7K5_VANPL|nr:hypothetical protein HPP92_028364 [Vanilla planifolia]
MVVTISQRRVRQTPGTAGQHTLEAVAEYFGDRYSQPRCGGSPDPYYTRRQAATGIEADQFESTTRGGIRTDLERYWKRQVYASAHGWITSSETASSLQVQWGQSAQVGLDGRRKSKAVISLKDIAYDNRYYFFCPLSTFPINTLLLYPCQKHVKPPDTRTRNHPALHQVCLRTVRLRANRSCKSISDQERDADADDPSSGRDSRAVERSSANFIHGENFGYPLVRLSAQNAGILREGGYSSSSANSLGQDRFLGH